MFSGIERKVKDHNERNLLISEMIVKKSGYATWSIVSSVCCATKFEKYIQRFITKPNSYVYRS